MIAVIGLSTVNLPPPHGVTNTSCGQPFSFCPEDFNKFLTVHPDLGNWFSTKGQSILLKQEWKCLIHLIAVPQELSFHSAESTKALISHEAAPRSDFPPHSSDLVFHITIPHRIMHLVLFLTHAEHVPTSRTFLGLLSPPLRHCCWKSLYFLLLVYRFAYKVLSTFMTSYAEPCSKPLTI